MSIFKAIAAAEEIPPAPRVRMEATIWLVGQGKLEAARALLACELRLEPPTRYAGTPTGGLCVTVVYPPEIAPILLDEERSETVNIRKAIDVALPSRYFIDQLHLESTYDSDENFTLGAPGTPTSHFSPSPYADAA
ncbi:MAG: hypothetical protein ABSC51_11765 [Gaiellaceae bacterium]|jgi:hypothetical protein